MTYVRFGLVGAIAATLTFRMTEFIPLTLDVSVWYFSYSLVCLLLPVGLVVYAFWISLGGRPLIGEEA